MPFKYLRYILTSILGAFALQACVDDDLLDDGPIGPGEADVAMTVSFYPNVTNDLGSRSPGKAIETIRTLQVAVFNEDGTLARFYNQNQLTGLNLNLTHEEKPSLSDEDAANGGSWTEGKQARATFSLQGIPYGRYRFYAIANHTVDSSTLISDDNKTAEQRLREITVGWSLTSAAANDQMFGYFTDASEKASDKPLAGLQANTITINRRNFPLHAWIKRLASKVTVAFDGSGLHQNVNIFIHKVTVKDIPRSCPLGMDNTPQSALANRSDVLHPDGETIYFNNTGVAADNPGDGDANHTKWLQINNGLDKTVGSDHSAAAPALFFYENMQGDYSDKNLYPNREAYNKEPKAGWVHEYLNRPDADWEKRPWDYDTKDNIATGTYIEVEGFYQSTNDLNTTSGPIKYRFMLGKNTTYNYNAQRNHHYKLTLKFRGWANQPEWHIEYVEEKPALYVPEPYYMPYLYNQRVDMPIRYIGDIDSLKVEIIDNDWGPFDKALQSFPGEGSYTRGTSSTAFLWNRPAWNTYNGLTENNSNPHQYLGFLALTMEKNAPANIIPDQTFNDGEAALNSLKERYYNTIVADCSDGVKRVRPPQHRRVFTKEELEPRQYEEGVEYDRLQDNYLVFKEGGARTLMLPLFTRAKTMILNSGYSGNNPYEYHHRKAKIRVVGYFANGDTIEQFSNVLQVPRITNPKAVWRRSGSTESFSATLMNRASALANADFVPMISEGSWSAEIEFGNKANFELAAKGTAFEEQGIIYGKTRTQISFDIKFKGASSACAVVLVKYNGEKCVHRIFLRQGYGAMKVDNGPNAATWACYNLLHGGRNTFANNSNGGIYETSTATGGSLVDSPLRFGSMFKRRNLVHGILESNNDTYGHMVSINTNGAQKSLALSSGTSRTWRNIMGYWLSDRDTHGTTTGETTDQTSWTPIKIGSITYYLPTYEQFKSLTDNSEYGFGILYGDGARTTQQSFAAATGYDGKDSSYGMRGVVVYNRTNARQIFFPISKSGHGRRNIAWQNTRANLGRLLYGDVDNVLKNASTNQNIFRPIPYNLPNNPGALYWIRKIAPKGHVEGAKSTACAAWDMNYFNFDFGPYTANCLYKSTSYNTEDTGSDALPIRLVTTK